MDFQYHWSSAHAPLIKPHKRAGSSLGICLILPKPFEPRYSLKYCRLDTHMHGHTSSEQQKGRLSNENTHPALTQKCCCYALSHRSQLHSFQSHSTFHLLPWGTFNLSSVISKDFCRSSLKTSRTKCLEEPAWPAAGSNTTGGVTAVWGLGHPRPTSQPAVSVMACNKRYLSLQQGIDWLRSLTGPKFILRMQFGFFFFETCYFQEDTELHGGVGLPLNTQGWLSVGQVLWALLQIFVLNASFRKPPWRWQSFQHCWLWFWLTC